MPKAKYDDASWHYDGDFPDDQPKEAGATHIGMFLAWMVLHDFASEELLTDAAKSVKALRARKLTGAELLMKDLDEKLASSDFNAEGNKFAMAYYEGKGGDSKYVDDYLEAFGVDVGHSLYTVADTWKHFDELAPKIDARYAAWTAAKRPKFIT